jgi:hypothetical protein
MSKLTADQFMALKNKLDSFNFKPQEIIELIKIIGDLREFLQNSPDEVSIRKRKDLLARILEYMMLNQNMLLQNQHLIELLTTMLNKLSIDKNKELEEETEEELELSEEEKKRRLQVVMYELHKVLNPRRIAGETSIENFLNNVAVRGIEVARKYQGHEHAVKFSAHDLVNLASYRHNLVSLIAEAGAKGFGRGL